MSVGDNDVSGRNSDSEQVDLIDLFIQLWRGKVTIVVCIVVAIVLAIGYLAVAKEKWTSTAIITQPDVGKIASYNNALNILYGSGAPKATELQANVIGRFSTSFSALSETLENNLNPEKLTIEQSVKGQQLPLVVSYVGASPEEAQRQLAEYIQQTDEKVAKELELDLADNIKLQTTTLQDSLKTQEVVAQEQKDLRIKQIQEALRYAQQAGVTKPQIQQTQDVTQDSMLLLGSDALKSMIEHESTRPLILSDNYFQTKQKLLDIENLRLEGAELHAYRYVMKPTLPIRRDSPKKSITLVLAVLLGGMIGAGIVLGQNAMHGYKAKAQ